MAKTIEEKEQFVQLRAKGFSFDKIAEELEVSKPTLLKWQAEFNEEIKEAQYFEYENLLNQYKVVRRARFEIHAKLLQASLEELEKRASEQELAELETADLLKLVFSLEKRLEKDTEKPLLTVPVPEWSFEQEEVVEL